MLPQSTGILFSTASDLLLILLMVGLTIFFLVAAVHLEKFISENYCKKCVNLSCMMNKVPEELKAAYLRRNPEMLRAWQACGYVLGNESTRESLRH